MRFALLLPFAALLTLPALPAAAESGHDHGGSRAAFHHDFHQHRPFHFRERRREFGRFREGRREFAGSLWGGGWGWGWPGDWDWGGQAPAAGVPEAPPVGYALPTPPPARIADERPSVETTSQGVVIIRGPGSRHVPP